MQVLTLLSSEQFVSCCIRKKGNCFLTALETDLIWLVSVNRELKKQTNHASDLVRIQLNGRFFCSCVKAVCVLCFYTRAMDRGSHGLLHGQKKNPVHNVEQRETAIVLVKLYEYSVNMCQQRQHYFKNDVWKILAVYINIYYLYFVFEIAKIWKVEIFIALKL